MNFFLKKQIELKQQVIIVVENIEKKEIVTDTQRKGKCVQKKISKISGSRRHPDCRVRFRIVIVLFSEYEILLELLKQFYAKKGRTVNQTIIEMAYQSGFHFEKEYRGCAQCVIGAIYEVFPQMRNADVFRSASGLVGGTGLSGKGQCGALSGAVMVLSQLHGRMLNEIEDSEGKRYVAYRLGEKIVEKFVVAYGTVICGEIQKKLMGRSFYLWDAADREAFDEMGGHTSVCPSVVGKATQWVVEIIGHSPNGHSDHIDG